MANSSMSVKDRYVRRRNRISIILAVIILFSGGVWAIANRNQLTQVPRADKAAASAMKHDIEALWQWNDKIYAGGAGEAEWSFRWDVSGSRAALDQLAKQLFTDENTSDEGRLYNERANSLTKEVAELGGTLTYYFVSSDSSTFRAIVLFATKGSTSLETLRTLISKVEGSLKEGEIAFSGSMTVRGQSEYDKAAEKLTALAGAKRIDHYDDGGTVSETFYTERLYAAIQAGEGQKGNLQIAVRRETDTGQLALIVGSPLITGDYAASEQ